MPAIVRVDILMLPASEIGIPSVPDRRIDHPPRLS
jgi:hypothetical protein